MTWLLGTACKSEDFRDCGSYIYMLFLGVPYVTGVKIWFVFVLVVLCWKFDPLPDELHQKLSW